MKTSLTHESALFKCKRQLAVNWAGYRNQEQIRGKLYIFTGWFHKTSLAFKKNLAKTESRCGTPYNSEYNDCNGVFPVVWNYARASKEDNVHIIR